MQSIQKSWQIRSSSQGGLIPRSFVLILWILSNCHETVVSDPQMTPFSSPNVKVVIHSIDGYGIHLKFAQAAGKAFEMAVNSPDFRRMVLSDKYTYNNNLTPFEIYAKILRADEEQGPGGMSGVIDLRVRTIRIMDDEKDWVKNCELNSRAGTIGIDGNGTGITAICPQRLELWAKNNDIAALAGHYAHEYMHILNFSHPSWGGWRQRKTVAYKVGDFIEGIVKQAARVPN